MSSRFTHTIARNKIPFLRLSNSPFCVHVPFFLICAPVDRHLGCFTSWGDVYIYLPDPVFNYFGWTRRSRTAGSRGDCSAVFSKPPYRFPQRPHHFAFPLAVHEGSSLSTGSPTLVFRFVSITAAPTGATICISSMISDAEYPFAFCGSLGYLQRNVFSSPLPIFIFFFSFACF